MVKISIGIPTYNRLAFFKKALDSCLQQTLVPFEIIVGDDSTNDETENYIKSLRSQIQITYIHNKPGLGQGKNINKIVASIDPQSDKFLLLHDDDLLELNALALLSSKVKDIKGPSVIYGKQYIINEKDEKDIEHTEYYNQLYGRTEERVKNRFTDIEAAIFQQFPNNGYLMDTIYFQSNPYLVIDKESEIGGAVDFNFGVDLAESGYQFIFLNKYISDYRLTAISLLRDGNDGSNYAFELVKNYPLDAGLSETIRNICLDRFVRQAIIRASRDGNKQQAIKIFFDASHRKYVFTLGGIKRFLAIFIKLFR